MLFSIAHLCPEKCLISATFQGCASMFVWFCLGPAENKIAPVFGIRDSGFPNVLPVNHRLNRQGLLAGR